MQTYSKCEVTKTDEHSPSPTGLPRSSVAYKIL